MVRVKPLGMSMVVMSPECKSDTEREVQTAVNRALAGAHVVMLSPAAVDPEALEARQEKRKKSVLAHGVPQRDCNLPGPGFTV